jgi:hypothetical protein
MGARLLRQIHQERLEFPPGGSVLRAEDFAVERLVVRGHDGCGVPITLTRPRRTSLVRSAPCATTLMHW